MNRRKLGCNDVSILGFGCMRFPTKDNKIDKEKTMSLLKEAYDRGISYFDTAWPYHNGESEIVLGEFLKTIDRASVFVADKMPIWEINEYDDLDQYFIAQLEKMELDYFDYYLLHAINKEELCRIKNIGMIDWLIKKKESGKIRNIGFSFHDEYSIFEEIIDLCDWDFAQIQLNYIDENYQAGLRGLRYAEVKGIDIVVMEPLRGGVLAKLDNDAVDLMGDLTISPAELAFRYLWTHQVVKVVLSGMNEMNDLLENVNSASKDPVILDEEEKKVIKKLKDYFDAKIKVPCTGCKYCMPCPFGVNIPLCFAYYNAKSKANDDAFFQYDAMMIQKERAHNCTGCGTCIEKCPQHINIPLKLKEVESEFGS